MKKQIFAKLSVALCMIALLVLACALAASAEIAETTAPETDVVEPETHECIFDQLVVSEDYLVEGDKYYKSCECGEASTDAYFHGGYCGGEDDGTNLTWTLDTETGVLEISGEGKMADWKMSSDGRNPWYDKNGLIKKVVIGSGITTVGNCAFEYSKVEDIVVPEGVVSFGEWSLANCHYLTSVDVPGSVEYIGNGAFAACRSLACIVIPKQVIYIGDSAFSNCRGLTNIIIPQNVETIGSGAFSRCYNLRRVIFESHNVEINDCFEFVSSEITISGYADSTAQTYAEEKGYLFVVFDDECHKCVFDQMILAEEYRINDIEYYKSCGCGQTSEEHLFFGGYCGSDSGENTRVGSTWILNPDTGIFLFDGYGAVGEWNNYKLTPWYFVREYIKNVTIGNYITRFEGKIFYQCPNLVSITIGRNVSDIPRNAIQRCYRLVEVINKSSYPLTAIRLSNDYGMIEHSEESKLEIIEGYVFFTDSIGRNLLAGYIGEETELVLPESYNGQNYEIKKYAFCGCDKLTSIKISDGVTSIGEQAFSGCLNLVNLVVGDNVVSIYGDALSSCYKLMSITLGKNFTTVLEGGFRSDNFRLVEVINKSNRDFPIGSPGIASNAIEIHDDESKLVFVDDFVFYTCNGSNYLCGYLGDDKIVQLPQSYNGEEYQINQYAFWKCTDIVSITIPELVTDIGLNAFACCYRLSEIINNSKIEIPVGIDSSYPYVLEVHDGESKVIDKDGYLFYTHDGENYLLSPANYSADIILPSDFNGENYQIKNNAFYQFPSKTNVIIPESVTHIGNEAFYEAYITSAYVPTNVMKIGKTAFMHCDVLETIVFESSITEIYDEEFTICDTATIYGYPGSTAEAYAIKYGRNFVALEEELPHECVYDQMVVSEEYECGRDYGENDELLYILYTKSCECGAVPENWEDMKYFYVGDCGAEGDNVTWIYDEETYSLDISGEGAMADYAVLVEEEYEDGYVYTYYEYLSRPWPFFHHEISTINIGDGITRIGAHAFGGFYNVTEVTIPGSVKWIGEFAFSSCDNLETVNFSEGLECVYEGAFRYCRGLQDITFPTSMKKICHEAFYGCESLVTVEFNEGLMSIYGYAFGHCDALTSVELPASLTLIDGQPFADCNLDGISVAEGNTVYHSQDNCVIKTADKLLVAGCKNSIIPADDSVTAIADSVFYNCDGLISIVLPDSITEIGDYAFAVCYELDHIDIPESLKYIGEGAFAWCESLDNVYLPEGLLEIGAEAFAYCVNLSEIEIPASVTDIKGFEDDEATKLTFTGCYSMKKLTVREGNTRYHSVDNCLIETDMVTLLQGISTSIIPTDGSVEKIGYGAFSDITTLESITIPDNINYIDECAFYGCESLKRVVVSENVYYIGRAAFAHCENLEKIVIKSYRCDIYDDEDTISDTATIYGYYGSTAEAYADEYDREFVAIPSEWDTVHVTIESKDAIAGDTVTVEISIDEETEIKSMLIENIGYDTDALELIDVNWEIEDAVISNWNWSDGAATLAFEENTWVKGTVLTLTFAVDSEYEGNVKVSADVFINRGSYEGGDEPLYVEVEDGIINVMEYARGDVNGDGFVDSNDAIYLLRYTLDRDDYPINQDGDMNGDGSVNSDDAIYLLRYTLAPSRYPLN